MLHYRYLDIIEPTIGVFIRHQIGFLGAFAGGQGQGLSVEANLMQEIVSYLGIL